MKKPILILFAFTACIVTQAQVLRPFAVRYNNPSVKGNIIQVANTIFTSVGGQSAGNPGNTTEAAPGGASRNNSTVGKNINIEAFVPFGSSWKYLANSASRPASWETTLFNDLAWPSNVGEFGYGDGDEATCVPSGGAGSVCAPTGTKVITTYFRKAITVASLAGITSFRCKVDRDDGFALYVNGVEITRNNLPGGGLLHSTVASADVNDDLIIFTIPTANFVVGNNVIAVEMHQRSAAGTGSDDLSFDLELTAITGTSNDIFNCSSANLNLPSCSQVLFAGLYWGGTMGVDGLNTSWIVNETSIKLKLPGSGVYTNLTSTQSDYHNDALVPGLPHTGYRCFRDITSLINLTSPNGTYTVANMATPEAIINGAAGWTIVIAYADPATIVRNLTVFDGSAIMNGGDPALNVPITGFLTPPSGPVSCELGAVVYDGDRTSVDAYMFKQNSNPLIGTYTNLTPNATSNINDMWNSTISAYGANITTRNPAHQNTLGYDADILVVPNAANAVLGNNATSASVQFASPSENYFIHTISTAISQYTPTFTLSKTSTDINGGTLLPGDEVRYQINFTNAGNDNSTATTIFDNIPAGTTYKPGSLRINGVVKSDPAANDEAEYDFTNNRVVFRLGTGADGTNGGEVAPFVTGNVTFEVYTARSCAVFACNSTISNRARISYGGKLSLLSLYDSSGVIIAGCNTPGPASDILTGSCAPLEDTILTNICPALTVLLPQAVYAGYGFYSAMPLIPANRYNPLTPITFTRIIYAFYDGPGSCDDTVRINVFITACPDIDDDNDGIPDYVEIDNALALGNHDADAFPNWNDIHYPGYVDNNIDGYNDNFDPSADSDNDGIVNFYDPSFPGWVDTNSDGVNDTMDKDLDGIPNHLDLDSDNDGIPDTVESFGVDNNGDGRIDNYTDTDNDGLSQNVDGNATGVSGSGTALGALDTDSDGIGNYLDLDSDNDGIPDIIEVLGADVANSARVSSVVDSDGDGYSDIIDSDADNNGTFENIANAYLLTSTDGNNDGRADSWPNKNMDSDVKPNPYDLDSDNDGITDVKEAQFTDADWNGRVDGALNSNGRNTALAGLATLPIPNSDGVGRANPYDIDSDDDGIPDNVEGLTTLGYILPGVTDTDNDGLINTYDNFAGFGGDGIHVVDTDADGTPDYYDNDTDNDGRIDRIEGNDLNLNGIPDDLVTLTGADTDGDGLDNRFDNNNSTIEGTSARMGNGGSFTGDATPGSITVVQRTWNNTCPAPERDWRCYPYVLSCELITFKAALQNNLVHINWTVLCKQVIDHFEIERSTDGINFTSVNSTPGRPGVNEEEAYLAIDNIAGLSNNMFYYRLRTVATNGKESLSNIIPVRRNRENLTDVQLVPNPVREQMQLMVQATQSGLASIYIVDANGRTVQRYTEMIQAGSNTFTYTQVSQLPSGFYYLRLNVGDAIITKKFNVIK